MKIKEVCELTGLTDRAVRYYIENGLVFPETGENYTGRRSFDFSEGDAERLRQIAVFRKAGFGIEQIREIFAGADVPGIVRHRIETLSAEREDSMRILQSLLDAEFADGLTADGLAGILEAPASVADIPQKDSDPPFARLLRNARRAIAGLCVGVCAMMLAVGLLFFGVFDGADWLGRRWSYGETLITVVVDGEVLPSDRFDLMDMTDDPKVIDKDLDYSYGCIFESSYGCIRGIAVLDDGTEIEFGFINSNNWHDPHIVLDVIRDEESITVRQTVTFKTDDERVTAEIFEITEPIGTKRLVVYRDWLL